PGRQGRSTRVNGGGLRKSSTWRAASRGERSMSDICRRSRGVKSSPSTAAGIIPAAATGSPGRAFSELFILMFHQLMQNVRQGRSGHVAGSEQGRRSRPFDADPGVVPLDGDLVVAVVEGGAFVLYVRGVGGDTETVRETG